MAYMKAETTESGIQEASEPGLEQDGAPGLLTPAPEVEPPPDVVEARSGDAEPAAESELELAMGRVEVPLSPHAVPGRDAARRPNILTRISSAIPSIGLDDRAGRLLLSILLACLLWFYVVSLENPSLTTVFNDLPVEVRSLSNGLKLVGTLSPTDVTVQAPQSALSILRPGDVRPYVDLSGLGAGVHTVPVRADVRSAQSGSMSVSLGPSTAQVQIEVEVSRDFPVQVQVTGAPAFGYGFDAAQSEPNIIRVIGPVDQVARVSKVIASVNIDDKAETQRGSRPPIALDESGSEVAGLTFDPVQVQVVVPIKLTQTYKVVGVRADTRGQPAAGNRVSAITTDPNTVTICCSPTVLNDIQFLDTLPVSVAGATFNVITRTELLLPPDVELYPGQTKAISVTVNVEPLVTTLQVSVAPVIEGQPQGASVIVSPDRLDLTLAGTFDQLQGLKPTDVRAFVSVQGREPGTYEIRAQFVVPQGVKLEKASPESVTVTLVAPTPVPSMTPTASPTSAPQSTATSAPQATLSLPTAGANALATTLPSPLAASTATPQPALSPTP